MNNYNILNDYIVKSSDKISGDFAYFLNHNFGNIVTPECIKQYVFIEGDELENVIEFIKEYYPEYEKNCKICKGIV